MVGQTPNSDNPKRMQFRSKVDEEDEEVVEAASEEASKDVDAKCEVRLEKLNRLRVAEKEREAREKQETSPVVVVADAPAAAQTEAPSPGAS